MLKWIGIILGVLVGLVLLAISTRYIAAGLELNRTYDIQIEEVIIPTEVAAIERGRQWVSVNCTGCHGDDLSGKVIFDDPAIGRIDASNLTSGQGGIGSKYSDADWVRAIRHGIGDDGKPLIIMPSGAFYYFSDGDLGDIVAYLKSVPPVDNDLAGITFTPIGRILIALGVFGELQSAESIDHSGPRPSAPEPGVTVAYGEYLVNVTDCRSCHGSQLSGGKHPEPGAPPGPNITPGGVVGAWAEAEFIETLSTGVNPYGRQLNGEFMPWKSYSKMGNEQLAAIYVYLRSLPASEYTGP